MRCAARCALVSMLVAAAALSANSEPAYKNPFDLVVSPDGGTLFVACSGTDSVVVADASTGSVRQEIGVGDYPTSVTIDSASGLVIVTNRDSDTVSVIDLESLRVVGTMSAGWAPMDALVNPRTGHLLVANSWSRDVSIIDLDRGEEVKRLRGGEGPRSLSASPDGSRIYLANLLPPTHPPEQPPVPEVTVIDADREVVVSRLGLEGANLVFGMDAAPDGSLLLALSRPKNLLPLVEVAGGWTMTSGVGLVRWHDGGGAEPAQLMLDSLNRHHSEPQDVAVDRAGKRAAVVAGGADELVIVDVEDMFDIVDETEGRDREFLGDRLDLSSRFVIDIVPTGARPVAVSLSPDGQRAYTANRLDDSVTVADMRRGEVIATFDLGGPEEVTQVRHGERLFFNAARSFNAQLACGSCHPDANHDGLVYDISPDGLGRNFVDSRTMLGVGGTAPFKWSGLNPTLHRQCGPRAAMFIFRSMGFTEEELDDLVAFLWSLELPRNRYRDPSGVLTELQAWGKQVFDRTVDNNGRDIPEAMRCNFCHSGERFTNLVSADVGSATEQDDSESFDTPSLNHLPETAPYLHDGRAMSLEELWTIYSPNDTHGRALDLSKDELNALVEYLKSL